MYMSRIVFRVDASELLGGGHVVRCATLANALMKRGAEIHFLCRTLPGNLCDWLEQAGFAVIRLRGEVPSLTEDVIETRTAIESLEMLDWLVVDNYGLDARWETSFRPTTRKIMVIDDMANRSHDCDILLDQNYILNASTRYDGLVPQSCRTLLGPRYAMLRKEFQESRMSLRIRDGKVRRLLICFGATDPSAHTFAAMQAVSGTAGVYEHIDVVTSPNNPLASMLEAHCHKFVNAHFHCPADNLAELLEAADLAIGAGGVMNWERACLALPTIAFGIVENQVPILESLIQDGMALGVASMPNPDSNSMAAWLAVAISNPHLLKGLSARSSSLVDGQGVDRVADALVSTEFIFRPVTLADSRNLFLWRNNPNTSNASISGSFSDFDAHEAWLKATLADGNRILLIIEANQDPVGVVRFDIVGEEATISIYRVPGSVEVRGMVRQATEWLKRNRKGLRRIIANVFSGNAASLSAFHLAGYRDSIHHLYMDL